jgi:hypothetical protein
MPTTPQQIEQPDVPRGGRQLLAFGFLWLAAGLLLLAGWLAISRMGRLVHWAKADAEIQKSEVYLSSPVNGPDRKKLWGAAVTIRYMANGQAVETSVDRGFQSGIRPWMEHWARHYPIGSHRNILFDPNSPFEADLDGEWTLASFSTPILFGAIAAALLWGWRRAR